MGKVASCFGRSRLKSYAYDTGKVCVSDFNTNLSDKDGNDTEHNQIFGLNKKGILKFDSVPANRI